ncbi:MAG: thioredoxin family protein [Actinobacteria bacterium]|nr:thioredoxin family protein [Actinomycetota bacterium]
MEIDLLYIADCPNRDLARRHLVAALARTDQAAVIRERQVRSADEAVSLGMRGSPTILIDGGDPFVEGSGPPALSCRLYRGEAGLRGVPTVDQLVEAMNRAGDVRPVEEHR